MLLLQDTCPHQQGARVRCGLAPRARCHPPELEPAGSGGLRRACRPPQRRAPPAGVRSTGAILPSTCGPRRGAPPVPSGGPRAGEGASGGPVPEAPSRAGAASPAPPGRGEAHGIRCRPLRGFARRAGFAGRPGPLHWRQASGSRLRSSKVARPLIPRRSPPWTGWPRFGRGGPRARAAQQVHAAEAPIGAPLMLAFGGST